MSIYICKCGEKKDLHKVSVVVIEGKVRVKEALCLCGEYMEEEDTSFQGFPNLIRTEPRNSMGSSLEIISSRRY